MVQKKNCGTKTYSLVFDIEKDLEQNCSEQTECCCTCCKNVSSKKVCLWISLATLKILLLVFLTVFVIFPLIYKYSYSLQRSVVFLNFVNLPKSNDYEHPEKFGLPGSRNFYLNSEPNVKLGVWQILPEDEILAFNDTESFESALGNGKPVILYNHGNAGSRGTEHRLLMYKMLRRHFHVITYDYRSYGDSASVDPTEMGVNIDSMHMINWIFEKKHPKAPFFIWGHSLGTSITTRSVSLLKKEKKIPTGVILESPFNNMKEEISEFPMAKLFKNLPWFQYTVVNPMQENGFLFQSEKYILDVDCPILILHALDDNVVPHKLGVKLFQAASEKRLPTQGKIRMHSFEPEEHLGHNYIVRSDILEDLVIKFVNSSINESETLRRHEQ